VKDRDPSGPSRVRRNFWNPKGILNRGGANGIQGEKREKRTRCTNYMGRVLDARGRDGRGKTSLYKGLGVENDKGGGCVSKATVKNAVRYPQGGYGGRLLRKEESGLERRGLD